MLRQILTLLALITGLAAATAPAQAVASGGRERVEIACASATAAHAQVLDGLQIGAAGHSAEGKADTILPPARTVAIPAALIGIDRARE